jgi:molecular chaperone DnaK
MGKIIGIDLGTTFSAVAQLDDTGRAVIVHNQEGENITASAVEFVSDELIYVGSEAKKSLGTDSKNVLEKFKIEMGRDKQYETDYGNFSPRELSTLVLSKLKKDTEEKIGEIDSAVVTIPANFSNNAREETIKAAEDAGLNVDYIINEPTAAALFYSKESGEDLSEPICVFDLGGGTFDVSIIQVEDNEVEVLGSDGTELGGANFDKKLQDLVIKKFKDEKNKNIKTEDFSLNEAEQLKISLSKREDALARAKNTNIKIYRKEFEKEISNDVAKTKLCVENALEEANLEVSDISKIVLAGGSTRIPCVRNSIKKIFGKDPTVFNNPDEIVALGAAIYAAYKADPDLLNPIQKSTVEKINIQELTTMCFGTRAMHFNDNAQTPKLSNTVIIERGSKIPISITEEFFTLADNQEAVDCSVTESRNAETDLNFVKTIWDGSLELPSGREAGQKIEVTFSFTANQTMECSFVDVATNRKTDIDLQMTNSNESDDDELDISQFTIE